MKKEYYDKQKAKYIRKQLRLTSINKVYYPLIIDIILRRQFEFKLDNEFFNRDVSTFIQNVDKIEVETSKKNILGAYMPEFKAIVINEVNFKKDNPEKILKTLAHECIHAMNIEEEQNGDKIDRTFKSDGTDFSMGIMEAFTECEADALVYNKEYTDLKNEILYKKTTSYSHITPYIDLIAATFRCWKRRTT